MIIETPEAFLLVVPFLVVGFFLDLMLLMGAMDLSFSPLATES